MAAARAIVRFSAVNDSMHSGPHSRHPGAREMAAPVDVVRSRGAAVVAAHLDVCQPVAGEPDRGRGVLLLDVHMERVDQDTAPGRVDRLDDLARLLDGIDHARLVAVERLDGKVTPLDAA